MKKSNDNRRTEEMLPEYDFSGGVRGKYAHKFTKGAIMVVLDPDVAEVFPDPESVNRALRVLGQIIQERTRKSTRQRSSR